MRRSSRFGLLAASAAAVALAFGCSSDEQSPAPSAGAGACLCTPGAQVSCACGGKLEGYQVCQADCRTYGTCQCTDGGVSGAGGSSGSAGAGGVAGTAGKGGSGGAAGAAGVSGAGGKGGAAGVGGSGGSAGSAGAAGAAGSAGFGGAAGTAGGSGSGGGGGAAGAAGSAGSGGAGGTAGEAGSGGSGGIAGAAGSGGSGGAAGSGGGGGCTSGTKQCKGTVPQTCVGGAWQDGAPCPYVCSAGQCTGVCVPGSKACAGAVPQTCDAAGQWAGGTACSGATPLCVAGQCVAQGAEGPSCEGLAATCGPSGAASCCASSSLPGGTYNRGNDSSYPATVSSFRLDAYEITVGRFRKFAAGFPGNKPASGAGKNPNNSADTGWDSAWNASMPANAAALASGVKCDGTYQTWTDTVASNESRPMNCITWYEAFAFCIWDGGRLPTEAEWNFAAAGGSEHRQYPWSAPPSSTTIDCTYASYHNGTTCCGDGVSGCAVTDLVVVGSKSPQGNGKWGHADMSGNAWEWVLDRYSGSYPNPCVNCANFAGPPVRMIRGGGFISDALSARTYNRHNDTPDFRRRDYGARCARSMP